MTLSPNFRKREVTMSIRLKVGFVGVLSCLVLVLALFFSAGVASAHGTQAAHSQASLTSLSTLTEDQCSKVYAPSGYYRGIYFTSAGYVTFCGSTSTCKQVYVSSGYYQDNVYFSSSDNIAVCQ